MVVHSSTCSICRWCSSAVSSTQASRRCCSKNSGVTGMPAGSEIRSADDHEVNRRAFCRHIQQLGAELLVMGDHALDEIRPR